MYSDSRGDVPAGSIGGLLHDDTRFVSRLELTIEGEPLSVLKSQIVDYYSAAFFLTNPDLPGVKVMLGLEHANRGIILSPHFPDAIGRVAVRGLSAFGATWDLEAIGT